MTKKKQAGIRINDELSIITGDPQGITIQYFYSNPNEPEVIGDVEVSLPGIVDMYSVSLSFKSVKQLAKEIRWNKIAWTIKDRSLAIFGDNKSIQMTFRMANPPHDSDTITLNEEDSQKFANEILKIDDKPEGPEDSVVIEMPPSTEVDWDKASSLIPTWTYEVTKENFAEDSKLRVWIEERCAELLKYFDPQIEIGVEGSILTFSERVFVEFLFLELFIVDSKTKNYELEDVRERFHTTTFELLASIAKELSPAALDVFVSNYLDVADMYEERLEELLHEDPFKTLANLAAWNCLGFVIGLDNRKAMKELELGDQEKREEADKFFHIIEGECYGMLRELSASIDYTLDDCRIQRAD